MRNVIQVGSLILSGILTAASIASSAMGIASIFGFIVPWEWIALVGFICFCGVTIWRMSEHSQRIKKFEEVRPSVKVKPVREHDSFFLEVENVGGAGTFEAQVEVVKGKEHVLGLPGKYSPYWAETMDKETEMMNGLKKRLTIASLITPSPQLVFMKFRFHYWELNYCEYSRIEGIRGIDSISWVPGSKQTVMPNFVIRVTISSAPSLREGAFIRDYQLSADGLIESPDGI